MQEDWEDLDALEFLSTDLLDKHGRPVVVVTAKNFPAKVVKLDRLQRWGPAPVRACVIMHPAAAAQGHARQAHAAFFDFDWHTAARMYQQHRACKRAPHA